MLKFDVNKTTKKHTLQYFTKFNIGLYEVKNLYQSF